MKLIFQPIYFLLAWGLVLLSTTGCKQSRIDRQSPRLKFSLESGSSVPSGRWKALGRHQDLNNPFSNHWFQAQVKLGNTHIYLASIDSSELFPLWQRGSSDSGLIIFNQSAGSIEFIKDAPESQQGSFAIKQDETFSQLAEELSGEPLTIHQLLMCIIQKTETQTLRDYAETGISLEGEHLWDWVRYQVSGEEVLTLKPHLTDMSAADVITLKRYGVKPDYVAKLSPKYPEYNAEDYTKIRRYGVSDSYALEVAESGLALSSDDMIKLRRYGVPSEWPSACAPLEKIHGVDDMVSLRRYGVSLDFLEAAHASSTVQSADDVINLRRRGVSTSFLKELGDATPPLSVDQVIQLRNAGVSADYFKAVQAAGTYSVEEVIQFRHRGVGIELIQAANPPDREPLSVDTIIELRNRGLSPKSVRELRQ